MNPAEAAEDTSKDVSRVHQDCRSERVTMEDGTTPVPYLEMTDRPAEKYAAERAPEVLALPGVQRVPPGGSTAYPSGRTSRGLSPSSPSSVSTRPSRNSRRRRGGTSSRRHHRVLLRPLPTTRSGDSLGQADARTRTYTYQCPDARTEPDAARLGRLRPHPCHCGCVTTPFHHDHAVREPGRGSPRSCTSVSSTPMILSPHSGA